MTEKTLRVCEHGHQYYKSTDCPSCPKCEELKKSVGHFSSALSAPARRALENVGITALKQLSTYSEKELLKLHGMGKASLPKLRELLAEHNLTFKP